MDISQGQAKRSPWYTRPIPGVLTGRRDPFALC